MIASDANGITWNTSQTLDATGTVGQYLSLKIINGNPAIAYYDNRNGDLKFVRSSITTGTACNARKALNLQALLACFPAYK